jgi:hypothetical protein
MKNNSFYSNNRYLFLPSKSNPRVSIAVDNYKVCKNSFKLYNPFSLKAKVLKFVAQLSLTYFGKISNLLFAIEEFHQSSFLQYLEKKLGTTLVSSVYFSPNKDKVVIQLQNDQNRILGYLKFPLNEIGCKGVINEIKAFDLLSSKGLVDKYILQGVFDTQPFLLVPALDGLIGDVGDIDLFGILLRYKRNKTYLLVKHPRILNLKESLQRYYLTELSVLLDEICNQSDVKYSLVYEHGDFAPWNIVNVDGSIRLFDFEYFVQDGLEHLDLIKFHYQMGKLIYNKRSKGLVDYLTQNLHLQEFDKLLIVFLMKEIVLKIEQNDSFSDEEELLKSIVPNEYTISSICL